jgi:GntR family transcriptional regulator
MPSTASAASTQAYNWIAHRILESRYRDGDRIPSVRALAAELALNPLTVSKAYQRLMQQRILQPRLGIGVFVADGGCARMREAETANFLSEEWPEIRSQIKRLGLEPDELIQRVEHR